jgi:hypothetical protein
MKLIAIGATGEPVRTIPGLPEIAADAEVIATAQTLPRESASTAILKKLGFVLIGTVNDPEDGEVWEWQIGGE